MTPNDLREEWERESRGRPAIVSVSGGKDSNATCLALIEAGIPYRAVHLDTGWEHSATAHYVREVLPAHVGPIEITSLLPSLSNEREAICVDLESRYMEGRESSMIRWLIKKSMFSSRKARWCTGQLKVQAFQSWARKNTDFPRLVNIVGVRADESKKRASLPRWDMDDDGYLCWRPILKWTEEDVIAIHHRHNVPPNPLYTQGAARVGCWPCVMCRKAEIRWIATTDPARIDLIRELETLISVAARARLARKGEPTHYDDGERKGRTFWPNPRWRAETRRAEAAAPEGVAPTDYARATVRATAPVDSVVEWSHTNRRGEHEPFAPLPHEDGCTRWGFCDVAWTDPSEQPSLFGGDGVHIKGVAKP